MTTPNPAQVRQMHDSSVLSNRIRAQAAEMADKLEKIAPSPARRARVRAAGYRGPMTRTELAALAARKAQRAQNG